MGAARVPGGVMTYPPTPLTLASSLRVDPCRGVLVAKAKRGNGIDSELYPVVFDPYKDSRSMGAGPKV